MNKHFDLHFDDTAITINMAAFAIALATVALLLAFAWPLLIAILAFLGAVKRLPGTR
jgi:hypothetical protein